MIQLLAEKGYEIVKEDDQAEVIVVNTCGFIQDAKEESINTLIEMGQYKRKRKAEGIGRNRLFGGAVCRSDF